MDRRKFLSGLLVAPVAIPLAAEAVKGYSFPNVPIVTFPNRPRIPGRSITLLEASKLYNSDKMVDKLIDNLTTANEIFAQLPFKEVPDGD